MKSTGVVRKIDSLGRIVIPKEIRKNLGIRDGEDIEIYLDNDKIILNKSSSLNSISKYANEVVDIVYSITKKNIIITDKNNVLSVNKEVFEKYNNKELSKNYLNYLEKRSCYDSKNMKVFDVVKDDIRMKNFCLMPIVVQGELLGSLFLFSYDSFINESDKLILSFLLKFLEKNLEDWLPICYNMRIFKCFDEEVLDEGFRESLWLVEIDKLVF